jgi:hypothetical protein
MDKDIEEYKLTVSKVESFLSAMGDKDTEFLDKFKPIISHGTFTTFRKRQEYLLALLLDRPQMEVLLGFCQFLVTAGYLAGKEDAKLESMLGKEDNSVDDGLDYPNNYWVDFESWGCNAKNPDHARERVEARLAKGIYPRITNIEEQ